MRVLIRLTAPQADDLWARFLKYLNGERFVICRFYKYTLLASTEFNLTVPSRLYRDPLLRA